MKHDMNRLAKVHEVEILMEYAKWRQKMPTLKFNSDWDVCIMPPIGGAIVRFVVEKAEASVSIYLDCYDNLGYYGEPYWEIYPYNSDVFRCDMNDTKSLLEAISESINNQLS